MRYKQATFNVFYMYKSRQENNMTNKRKIKKMTGNHVFFKLLMTRLIIYLFLKNYFGSVLFVRVVQFI